MPQKGSEIGIAAVGASFVLSIVVAVAVDRPRRGRAAGTRGPARARPQHLRRRGGRARPSRSCSRSSTRITWWQNGARRVRRRHPHRRPRGDDAVRRHAHLAARARLLDRVPARATSATRTTTRCSASSPRRCCSLVVADNTLQLLVGWEGVGLCSFALIGHWWEEGANSDAALKAFLTTRTGDIGLMIGIIITFFAAGTLQHRRDQPLRARARAPTTALLLAGAVVPLHRHHRQERPVPAPHLAARRHGRPDPGVGADPRRHHGRRRRVPRRPPLPRVLRGLLDRRRRRSTSWR